MPNDFADFGAASGKGPWPQRRDNSDQALLAKVAAGNRLAIQVLYARHHTRVYRFLLRLVCNADLAEELTTKVFVSAWRHARAFDGSTAVSTWLIAIARRKAPAGLQRGSAPPQEQRQTNDATDVHLREDRSDALRHCLTQLSPEQREVMDLVYYHQKSLQDVADIIGISPGEVKTRMLQARTRLSTLLELQGAPDLAGPRSA